MEPPPFTGRHRPHRIVRRIAQVEATLVLAAFVLMPAVAVVAAIWLARAAAVSSDTQGAATSTAQVVASHVSVMSGKGCPCYRTRLRLTDLRDPRGDGVTITVGGNVTGSGTQPGAVIAVKQDPNDARHVELPGYPDVSRGKQAGLTLGVSVIGLAALLFDLWLLRRLARTGHLGHVLRAAAWQTLPPRPPKAPTTRRLVTHYLLPAIGLPLLLAGVIAAVIAGGLSTGPSDVTTITAVH